MQQLSASRHFRPQKMMHWDAPTATLEEVNASDSTVIRFGRCCVLRRARQLLVDGRPVELGGRAFDLLIALIGERGTLLTKNEIISRVWPNTVVAEENLKVQMATLRKVLNEDQNAIKTVHGRGYVFTGEITTASVEPNAFARPSQGSTTLPLEPLATVSSGSISSRGHWMARPRKIAPNDATQPTVVVIDDDPDVREALQGLLRTVGLRVALFASVQEFLDSGHSDPPGCLVLDVRLPGRSGLDFQEELAKANVRLPIVFISGHADVPMSVRAMKAGAVEFLTKPVRDQDLLDAIHQAIAQGRARRDDE